jgi:hypothetical protein
VTSAEKQDFFRELQNLRPPDHALAKFCLACGAELVYLNAKFQVYGESTNFTIPMGFCPYCDGIPAVISSAVA